ncbi:MAG: hypothetical protein GVX96_00445 [Bacteroidetes bacterium]|jgi:hypothetical protein|nr:hypothetical protein [Bacteroidota bacterium]
MKNNIDKHIREKLDGYEISPAPSVWSGIQGQLKASAKRQYGWLAGVFFVLIFAAGISYYYLNNQHTEQEKANTAQDEIATQNELAISADWPTPIHPEETFAKESQDAQGRSKVGKDKNNSISKDSRLSSQAPNRAQKDNTKASKSQVISKNEAIAAKISSYPSARDQTETTGEQEIAANQKNELLKEKDVMATESKSDETSFIENSWAANNSVVYELESNNNYNPLQTAAFLTLEEKQKRKLHTFDICDVLYPSLEDCPEFGDRRRRYQIDAYAQTGRLFSHLTNNQLQEEVNSYLNQRRSTENPSWHVGFGVRLSTQWTSGISLRGGLQIAQSRIRVDYVDESESQTTVNVSIDTITDPDGNTTVIWDTISVIQTGVIERSHTNTFTQIDIPVTVGYTFFGPRYDVEVNAGVMFNVLFQRSGRVFGPDDKFYDLGRTGAAPGEQPYSSDLGMSLVTSVALNYRLSHQFSVFVEPQLRYFLDPVSPGDYPLRENWFIGSLMLGGRYAF